MGHASLFQVVDPLNDLACYALDAVHTLESIRVLFQFLVEVIAEHLKNQAKVLPEFEPVLQPNYSMVVRALDLIYELQ